MAASVSMDYLEAHLNPCSVESIPEPVAVPADNNNNNNNNSSGHSSRRIWPVMVSCYELQEATGKRHGRLDLYAVKVPDMHNAKSLDTSMVLRFGRPIAHAAFPNDANNHSSSLPRESGILDGKWIRAPDYYSHADQKHSDAEAFYFASAHSTGDVVIHSCVVKTKEEEEEEGVSPVNFNGESCAQQQHSPMHMEMVGRSERLTSPDDTKRSPLCLSLSWDSSTFHDSSRIVSTYSDGRVAIHDVLVPTQQQLQSLSPGPLGATGNNHSLHLFERDNWEAHTMFTSPAEVWSAGFVGGRDTNMVMSGGDEGTVKVWDIRSTNRPTQVLKHFEAGATVVAPHPRNDNLVACGSYDETICLYDIRYLSPKKPLGHSGPLGGGIWRIKWHPIDDCQMLVAAMHGGCRIIQVDTLLENDTPVLTATKEFTEHKSMAYGADWLVCNHPTQEGYFEAAASCSFYDKAVYLWDTVA